MFQINVTHLNDSYILYHTSISYVIQANSEKSDKL